MTATPAASSRAPGGDRAASGPASAPPTAKPVISTLAPVGKILLRKRSGDSRRRTANRAVSRGPSPAPIGSAAPMSAGGRPLAASASPAACPSPPRRITASGATTRRASRPLAGSPAPPHTTAARPHPAPAPPAGGTRAVSTPWAEWLLASFCLALTVPLWDLRAAPAPHRQATTSTSPGAVARLAATARAGAPPESGWRHTAAPAPSGRPPESPPTPPSPAPGPAGAPAGGGGRCPGGPAGAVGGRARAGRP